MRSHFWTMVLLTACGGAGLLSLRRSESRASEVTSVAERLAGASPRVDDTAYAWVTEDGYLVGTLGTNREWRQLVHSAASAPLIAGNYVVVQEESGVVVRDLRSGEEVDTFADEGLYLAGADGEGEDAVVALSSGSGVGAVSKVVYLGPGGVRWGERADFAVGSPALVGGDVVLPWATQNVSVFSRDREEIARIRFAASPVGVARRTESGLVVAQLRAFGLTAPTDVAALEAASYTLPELNVPGNLTLVADPYRRPQAVRSAAHRLRYVWLSSKDGDNVRGQTLILQLYRFVFGLSGDGSELLFAYTHDHDFVGADLAGSELHLVDAHGGRLVLDSRTGGVIEVQAADDRVSVAAVRVRFGASRSAEQAASLDDQLAQVLSVEDATMVPPQLFAVRELAERETDAATDELLKACVSRRAAPALVGAACEAIAEGARSGAPLAIAIASQGDFLRDTEAPPVGVLARGLTRLPDPSALPALLRHLWDPRTPIEALGPLATAIAKVADGTTAESLVQFVRLYHAEDARLESAIESAVTALVELSPEKAAGVVAEALEDPFTPEPIRLRLQPIAAQLARVTPESPEESTVVDGETSFDFSGGQGAARLPTHTSESDIRVALMHVDAQLRSCFAQDNQVFSMRVILDLDGQGGVLAVVVHPAHMQACVEPLVRRGRFVGNARGAREQLRYTIRR